MKNIYAYTDISGPNPGYISVNEQDDGTVSVSVRTRGAKNASFMSLTPDQVAALGAALAPAPVAAKPAQPKAK
jgi:hypothetical protein